MKKLVALACLLTAIAAWAVSKDSNVLTYCIEGDVTGVNPAVTNSLTSEKIVHDSLYDQLLKFGDTSTEFRDGLAKLPNGRIEMTEENVSRMRAENKSFISEDGMTYEFQLKSGVPFHSVYRDDYTFEPSRDFNARDVVYTFSRFMFPSHPLHTVESNPHEFPYWRNLKLSSIVDRVVMISEDRVRFELKEASGKFLMVLAIPLLSIQSEEYGNFVSSELGRPEMYDLHPVGTGPYQLRSFTSTRVIYDAFENYYRGAASIPTIDIKVVRDPIMRPQMAATGECDISADPDVNEFERMSGEYAETLNFVKTTTMNVGFLAINNEKIPEADLRMAISVAMDRPKYVQNLFSGHANAARSVLYPDLNQEYRSDSYTYQPEKARELIQGLLKNGLSRERLVLDLWYMPVSRPYNPNPRFLGEMMKEDLEAVGFTVNLSTIDDWGVYLDEMNANSHSIAQIGLNSVLPVATDLYSIITSAGLEGGNNWTNWSDPRVDQKVDEMRMMSTQEELQEAYTFVEQILEEAIPMVPVLNGNIFRIVNKRIKNYHFHPTHAEDFHRLRFE